MTQPEETTPLPGSDSIDEEETVRKQLREIFLLSTIFLTFSALLLRFFTNLLTTILLVVKKISFYYSLFNFGFFERSELIWSRHKIIIVFGTATFCATLAGILLMTIKFKNWKINLAVTWMALILFFSLPLSMLAGIFVFKGFGVAMMWTITGSFMRAIVTAVIFLFYLLSLKFWVRRFLLTAYSKVFLDSTQRREEYIRFAFVYPLLTGTGIITAFACSHLIWDWAIFAVGLNLILFPLLNIKMSVDRIKISKSHTKMPDFHKILLYSLSALFILWIVSYASFTFK